MLVLLFYLSGLEFGYNANSVPNCVGVEAETELANITGINSESKILDHNFQQQNFSLPELLRTKII